MNVRPRRVRGKPEQLCLFDWRPSHDATLSYAALVLSRRHRLRPPIARIVAEAMGFDAEARR